jgi:Family of unknown function (DUF5372)
MVNVRQTGGSPGDEPGQCREPQPVTRLVADPADLTAQHRVLMTQDQQLGILGHLTPDQHRQAAEHAAHKQVDDREDHPAMISARGPARSSNRAPHDPHDWYRRVRVTHPFHPLAGRDLEFVAYRQNWGEDRVHLHDENGQLFSLVPCQNSLMAADQQLFTDYAALWYSLISPPATLLRSIRAVTSTTRPGCRAGILVRPVSVVVPRVLGLGNLARLRDSSSCAGKWWVVPFRPVVGQVLVP